MIALKNISKACGRFRRTPWVRAVGDGRLKTSTASVRDSIAVVRSFRVRRFMGGAQRLTAH
jgi:hypothetical protein